MNRGEDRHNSFSPDSSPSPVELYHSVQQPIPSLRTREREGGGREGRREGGREGGREGRREGGGREGRRKERGSDKGGEGVRKKERRRSE